MAINKKKVVKIKKSQPLNIGTLLFGALFIYMFISFVLYLTSSKITMYEVTAGSLVSSNLYTGIIIREETVVQAEKAGTINYYAREGEKVGTGGSVFSLDESGSLSTVLDDSEAILEELTSKDLSSLRTLMMNYSTNYNEDNFFGVYSFKYDVEGSLQDILNEYLLDKVRALSLEDQNALSINTAPVDGIVAYYTDGYETVTTDDITSEDFDQTKYEKNSLRDSSLVSTGDAAYKLITSENWSLVIPIDENTRNNLENTITSMRVTFTKDKKTSTASVSFFGSGTENYMKLDFIDSMVRYVSERYLEVELLLEEISGLKIPQTSIVDKEFFVIPKEYLAYGGNQNEAGFLRRVIDENNNISAEFVPTSVYQLIDDVYYVDMVTFQAGDVIIQEDSTNEYQISKTGTLKGVYNINKGYAVFREITIIDQNEEYCIVESASTYGLAQYDHIVLDSSTVSEEDIVY